MTLLFATHTGTFYMWEEMQAPIVPFVIFGAYDLYPVGRYVYDVL